MRKAKMADPILMEMVQAIRALVPAERIVLFGSRARGGHHGSSDYDLLVVVPDENYFAGLPVKLRRTLDGLPGAKDLLVTKRSSLERQAAVPGTVCYEAVKDGVTLYATAQA